VEPRDEGEADMRGTKTIIHPGFIAALLLVGAAACGGGDGGGDSSGGAGAAGLSEGAGDGGGDAIPDDPCSLLERSQVEQQYGALGPVSEGERFGYYCSWNVGATNDTTAPVRTVMVGVTGDSAGGSLEDFVTQEPPTDSGLDIELNPTEVEVSGIATGDALYDAGMGSLWVRSGDHIVFASDLLGSDDPSSQGKLIALAELVLEGL
jgi:hypothetical protein